MDSSFSKDKAALTWPILVECAASKNTITYGELAEKLGTHTRPLKFPLTEIQNYCAKRGLAPLSILVVNRHGKPGEGFKEWVTGSFEADLASVFDEDWNFPNPFVTDSKKPRRNPNWSRDELILALDLYLDVDGQLLDDTDRRVIELSMLLNKLYKSETNENFRNPNGVSMKLGNFSRFDPQHLAAGRKGLSRGAKADELVWEEFNQNRTELKKIADSIKDAAFSDVFEPLNETENDPETVEAKEGKILTRIHRTRERDPKLVKKKKDRALKEHGCLVCEACNFDFYKVYGEHGRGYIECHHTVPLSNFEGQKTTKLKDLALLCANCHRMVHSKRKWLTIPELKSLLRTRI